MMSKKRPKSKRSWDRPDNPELTVAAFIDGLPDDVIKRMLKVVLEHAPDIDLESVRQLDKGIRAEYGGAAHYFQKRPADDKAQRLGEQIAKGVPILEAFKIVGLPRSTGYRLLKRKPSAR